MDPGVIAAYIASGAAIATTILGSIVTIKTTRETLRNASVREIGKTALDLCIRQLNELYAPLLLLNKQNKRLAMKLLEGVEKPEGWHLLNNLEVLGDPRKKLIVDEILSINDQIKKILTGSSGLVVGVSPPQSFEEVLSHINTLELAVRKQQRLNVSEYYPKQFDIDIEQGFQEIKEGLQGTLSYYQAQLMTPRKADR